MHEEFSWSVSEGGYAIGVGDEVDWRQNVRPRVVCQVPCVVRKDPSAPEREWSPSGREPGLFQAFIACRSDEELLGFANRYGFLYEPRWSSRGVPSEWSSATRGEPWPRWGTACYAEGWFDHSQRLLPVLDSLNLLPEVALSRAKAERLDFWRGQARLMEETWHLWRSIREGGGTPQQVQDLEWLIFHNLQACRPAVAEQRTRGGASVFGFVVLPRLLIDHLWCELAAAIVSDQDFRQCKYADCEQWFAIGPGFSPKNAEFCPQHRGKGYAKAAAWRRTPQYRRWYEGYVARRRGGRDEGGSQA